MNRSLAQVGCLAFFGLVTSAICAAQDPAPAPAQNPSPAPVGSTTQQKDPSVPAVPDSKRPKKVWTNENVADLNGSVSVVGNSKNPGKAATNAQANPQYIAETRKQLEKLQSQLDDTDKQLAALQDFSKGKPPATPGGYQINGGYIRVPVNQQILTLQDKKKQLTAKIDALLDEARKKGVEPGDLR
jgi:hypothetical protein